MILKLLGLTLSTCFAQSPFQSSPIVSSGTINEQSYIQSLDNKVSVYGGTISGSLRISGSTQTIGTSSDNTTLWVSPSVSDNYSLLVASQNKTSIFSINAAGNVVIAGTETITNGGIVMTGGTETITNGGIVVTGGTETITNGGIVISTTNGSAQGITFTDSSVISTARNRFSLVQSQTTSANATTFTFSGLNGNQDGMYVMIVDVGNPTLGAAAYNLYVNGDIVSTDYYRQYLQVTGTAVNAGRINDATVTDLNSGEQGFVVIFIKKTADSKFRAMTMLHRHSATILEEINYFTESVFTLTNITSLDYRANVNNGISSGSSIDLYRTR